MLFASWLTAGHREIGLKSNFAHAGELQEALDLDSYGAGMCMCGDYTEYPLIFPNNELIVGFPTADKNDEVLFHIWDPSGFEKICGGPCGRRRDGRGYYYLSSQYLAHNFEIYEARTKMNYWHKLFGTKGICKVEAIALSTQHHYFIYNLKHESVNDLAYEIRTDMFLKYIIEPLLKPYGIMVESWGLTLHDQNYIDFNRAGKQSKLDLKVPLITAHELVKVIDQHMQKHYDILFLDKILCDKVFEDFNTTITIATINKDMIRKILHRYLDTLKTLIPDESFKDFLAEDITRLQYGSKYITSGSRGREIN